MGCVHVCMGACASLLFNSPGRKSFEKVVSVFGPLCVSAEKSESLHYILNQGTLHLVPIKL